MLISRLAMATTGLVFGLCLGDVSRAENLHASDATPVLTATPTHSAPPLGALGLTITAFRHIGSPSTVTNGPVATAPAVAGSSRYAIDVKNFDNRPITTALAVTAAATSFNKIFPIALGAGQSTTLLFTDPRGLANACAPVAYALRLDGAAAHTGTATPACTFQISSVGATDSAQTNGFLYYQGARLRSTPRCQQRFDVAARVINGADNAAGVSLVIPFPGNVPTTTINGFEFPAGNRYAVSPKVLLLHKGDAQPLFTTQGAPFGGDSGIYPLTIKRHPYGSATGAGGVDTTTAAATPTWSIRVQRGVCTVTTKLD